MRCNDACSDKGDPRATLSHWIYYDDDNDDDEDDNDDDDRASLIPNNGRSSTSTALLSKHESSCLTGLPRLLNPI